MVVFNIIYHVFSCKKYSGSSLNTPHPYLIKLFLVIYKKNKIGRTQIVTDQYFWKLFKYLMAYLTETYYMYYSSASHVVCHPFQSLFPHEFSDDVCLIDIAYVYFHIFADPVNSENSGNYFCIRFWGFHDTFQVSNFDLAMSRLSQNFVIRFERYLCDIIPPWILYYVYVSRLWWKWSIIVLVQGR